MSRACNFDEEPERKQLISDDRADLLVAREALDEVYDYAIQFAAAGLAGWAGVAEIIEKARAQFKAAK